MPVETEEMIDADTVFSERKKYTSKEREYSDRARRELKPFCFSCFSIDHVNSDAKEFNDYVITSKPVKTLDVFHHKDSTKQVGRNIDFKCPKNHGVTLYLSMNEIPIYDGKEKK